MASTKTAPQEANCLSILGFLELPITWQSNADTEPLTQHLHECLGGKWRITHSKHLTLEHDANWQTAPSLFEAPAQTSKHNIHILIPEQALSIHDGKLMLIPGSHYPNSLYGNLLEEAFCVQPNLFELADNQVPGHTLELAANTVLLMNAHLRFAILDIQTPKAFTLLTATAQE